MADQAPSTIEDTSTLATSKKMQYAKLHDELAKLNNNVQTFGKHIKVTVEQVPSVRQMGNLHASLFMSVNKVIQPNSNSSVHTHHK